MIATGFPEADGLPQRPHHALTAFERPERVERTEERAPERERGRIFNSLSVSRSEEPKEEPAPPPREEQKPVPPPKEPKPVDPVDEDDSDDDWGAVPAFLRRSKLK